MDNKILTTIINKFKGGPAGIGTIATAVVKTREQLKVYEPFLIKEGLSKEHQGGRGYGPCIPASWPLKISGDEGFYSSDKYLIFL